MQHLLESSEYADTKVVDDLCEGMAIVGNMPVSNVMTFEPPTCDA